MQKARGRMNFVSRRGFDLSHAGVALEDQGDESVVTAGEQGGALGGEQDAESVGDDLLGSRERPARFP